MYRSVVFGGGGTRCFWQGGFLHAYQKERDLDPSRISGVSGGAMTACGFVSGKGEASRDAFADAFAKAEGNRGNMRPSKLLDEGDVLIHEDMYHDLLVELFGSEETRQQIANGPELHVLLAAPPTVGARLAVAIYGADMAIRDSPHTKFASAVGAHGVKVDARQAARDDKVVELLLATASAPPVFELKEWDGQKVMDGGIVDNAPLFLAEPEEGERALVLLTRQYDRIPERSDCDYVAPSREPPTFKLDFTDREGIIECWNLGIEDGESFLRQLDERERAFKSLE